MHKPYWTITEKESNRTDKPEMHRATIKRSEDAGGNTHTLKQRQKEKKPGEIAV